MATIKAAGKTFEAADGTRLVNAIEERSSKNQKVQEFYLGLDFKSNPGGVDLISSPTLVACD